MAATTTAKRWGAIIRERRQMLGLSQYALAEKLGVRQGAVSFWERGTRLPSRRSLARIRAVLGLPESAFVYEDEAA